MSEEPSQPHVIYPPHYSATKIRFKTLADKVYLHELPSYGNKIFYGLGFLALTSLALLVVTGSITAFMGQSWWLFKPFGVFTRSVHLWSVQAFILALTLHCLVGFITSGSAPTTPGAAAPSLGCRIMLRRHLGSSSTLLCTWESLFIFFTPSQGRHKWQDQVPGPAGFLKYFPIRR
jgi:hypothetical protein